ncbi:PAS domain-containing sensor histidine kinase [Stenotrophomonas sp. PS02289]|uniref:hybrid sensor histidine kinase/response regulator n=1 Tax=Stenotrophomonas sp. PS02289 TaxID=2991422 RepID=UPI00249AE90F|nr:PAS domain-containing sensor histidine kinase [Stenotrophomonas sp. PS02289]
MTAPTPPESRSERATESVNMALAAGAIVGTWFWDVANDRLTIDEALARAFGLDPDIAHNTLRLEEVLGGVHPDDRPGLSAAINAAVQHGGRFAHQYRTRSEDGGYHWLEGIGRVDLDAQGRPIGFPGVIIDISERRRFERERDDAQQLLRSFVEAAPGVVYAKDRQGRILIGNRGTTDLIGRPPEQYVGHTDAELLNDPAQAAVVMATDERIMSSGDAEQVEEEVSFPDGRRAYWLSTKAPLRDASGQVVGLVGTSLDITDRKSAHDAHREIEERYRLAAQATNDAIWDWRISDGQVIWNEALGSLFGHETSETTAQWWLEHIHPDDRERIDRDIHAVIEGHGSSWSDEYRFQRFDGSYATVFDRGAVLRNAAGEPVRMIGAMLDLSERYAVEARLKELNEQLESRVREEVAERLRVEEALRQSQKMEAVGHLTGGIAHDFNNMLATVIGPLDLLEARLAGSDPRAARYIEMAMDGAMRAAQLTQRLLAFSRQQPLQPTAVDANKLVAGMSDLLVRSLGSSVQLETVLAGGLWWTHADPNQLENVILNLAVNARDAMPGGGRLKVETSNCDIASSFTEAHPGVAPGEYVLIAVSDTGSGMSPEVMAKAFDPFYTTKDVGQGTGLGLSQVYGFVQQSAGQVKLHSDVGMGTTVKVYLPRRMAEPLPAASPTAQTTPLPGGGPELILVVDDEPLVRQFSVEALGELGYQVLAAEGAATALALLDAHPQIALLFTDVVMPEVNGRQLADQALARRPDLKVLFTTGNSRNALVDEGVLDANVHLIGKPFTVGELATRVRTALEA